MVGPSAPLFVYNPAEPILSWLCKAILKTNQFSTRIYLNLIRSGKLLLFLDTANLDEIKEIADWGVLGGITTNPSLVSKEHQDFKKLVKEICKIVPGPVSAEVTALDTAG